MYGLYVHIPFCRRKCNYCDFASQAMPEDFHASYLAAMAREMQTYAGQPLATVFVGGGTPSLLAAPQIDELFRQIRHTFNCTRLGEVTFEANPESLDDEKLRVLKKVGVNRLSIGAQSFNDGDLVVLGRVHTADDFARAYAAARRFGFANINIDLIYGLPGQDTAAWRPTLEKAVAFGPQHLSLYPLAIEPGTAFERSRVRIDEDRQAELYEWSIDFLAGEGFEQYEISNWARSGYVCRHNCMYWQNGEYIGVGAAASSHMGCRRWKNIADPRGYVSAVNDGQPIVAEEETLDDGQCMAEDMILKLRCRSGIALSPVIDERYGQSIERLMQEKLLERVGENIRLTRRGMLLANQVLQEFV
jgi:oxygen-independent coproporphyrinogen-3 oxidase